MTSPPNVARDRPRGPGSAWVPAPPRGDDGAALLGGGGGGGGGAAGGGLRCPGQGAEVWGVRHGRPHGALVRRPSAGFSTVLSFLLPAASMSASDGAFFSSGLMLYFASRLR